MTAENVVCAVDVGTSAVRASLISGDGTELCSTRRPREVSEGTVDFDPDLLWDDVATVLCDLATMGSRAPRCLAIAGHIGAVLLDEAQHPIGRGIGWANTVGADLIESSWADPLEALHIAGRPAVTGGAAAFLAWLRTHQPQTHRRVRWVLSPKDDLIRRLSGVLATDFTSAGYSLVSDVRRRDWSATLAAAAGLSVDCFPRQHPGTRVVGYVHEVAAARTRLPVGLPIVAGGPDGTVGMAAVAGARQGIVVDVAGTTDVLTRVVLDPDNPVTRDTVCNAFLVDGYWSCGGPTGLTGGALARWTHLLGLGDPAAAMERLGDAITALSPGADGLFMLPFFTGSRFPDWRPDERAALWGMDDKHTNAHIVRAAQEAAAFVVRMGLGKLMSDDPTAPVVLAGGSARSASLSQLRADVIGRPVLACADPDVTLRGAAMLACVGAGIHATLDDASAAMAARLHEFTPDTERAATYRALFDEWCRVRGLLGR